MSKPIRPTKKQIERWQFDRFIELAGLLPGGKIVESEEPDFLVTTPDGILGVELTNLFWEQTPGVMPRQAIEALRARIAEQAGQIYSTFGLPAVHASVNFSASYLPSTRDDLNLPQAIADLVAANVPAEGQHFCEKYDWKNHEYFPKQINNIRARLMPEHERSLFTSSAAGIIPNLKKSDIERALALKEPKLDSYRRVCAEAWLVINFDGDQLATVFEHDEVVSGQEYLSGFDRAFLLRRTAGKVHELCLRRAEA